MWEGDEVEEEAGCGEKGSGGEWRSWHVDGRKLGWAIDPNHLLSFLCAHRSNALTPHHTQRDECRAVVRITILLIISVAKTMLPNAKMERTFRSMPIRLQNFKKINTCNVNLIIIFYLFR